MPSADRLKGRTVGPSGEPERVGQHGLRLPRERHGPDVERCEVVCTRAEVQDVARRITCERAGEQHAMSTGLQVQHRDLRLRQTRGGVPHGEEHVAPIGERLRPPVPALPCGGVERADRSERPSVRRHRHERGAIPSPREVDAIVRPPARARRVLFGADHVDRLTASNRDLLDFAVGEEAHPLAIERDEGVHRVLRARQRTRRQVREPPDVEPVRPEHQEAAVGREHRVRHGDLRAGWHDEPDRARR